MLILMFKESNGTQVKKQTIKTEACIDEFMSMCQWHFREAWTKVPVTLPLEPPKTHEGHQHHVSPFPWLGHKQEALTLRAGELQRAVPTASSRWACTHPPIPTTHHL